ncbi:RCC1 domain-containing protein, partial [Chryseobacterium artocarpi]|uniref:RCC1 domain-containing protein n=1 Tax=Chryseobacterium artocarpi TaxID=1414727 RepID=UPI003F40BCB6
LGDGTTVNRNIPEQVGTATNWLNIAGKNGATYATKTDGTLWAWGYNYYGQLGNGTNGAENIGAIPVQIGTSSDNLQIFSGENYALVKSIDGSLKASGQNNYGQLGDGTSTTVNVNNNKNTFVPIACPGVCIPPTQFLVTNLTSATATLSWTASTITPSQGYQYLYSTSPFIGGNNGSTISTTVNLTNLLPGTTYYWWVAPNCGFSWIEWESGGSFTTLPTTETGCWQSVDAGLYHSIGLKVDGTLWAWGDNHYGQLGDGTNSDRNKPTQIGTANNWTKISAGIRYSVGLKSDGTLWTWGSNIKGQLGNGTTTERNIPTQVGTATDWVNVATGDTHTLALKSDGTLWAWGLNDYGQLGDDTTVNKTTPIQIGTANDWLSIAAGMSHSLAIKTDGTLWAWGDNSKGQLGDGTIVAKKNPTQIGTATNWKNVDGGNEHSTGLKTDGTIWAWGDNRWGQLGDGTEISKNIPTQLGVETNWRNFATGYWGSTLAIKTDGTLWAWGYNSFGQLGDGTITHRYTPISIGTVTDRQSVALGSYHGLVINNNGFLSSAGHNGLGQLGDGTTASKPILTPVACPTSNIVVVGALARTMNEASMKADQLKVYPNPVQDILTISLDQKIISVTVYNTAGNPILTKTINDTKGNIDVSGLLSGVYQVKVIGANDFVKTVQIIKR